VHIAKEHDIETQLLEDKLLTYKNPHDLSGSKSEYNEEDELKPH
jgi:hypothetical protein